MCILKGREVVFVYGFELFFREMVYIIVPVMQEISNSKI